MVSRPMPRDPPVTIATRCSGCPPDGLTMILPWLDGGRLAPVMTTGSVLGELALRGVLFPRVAVGRAPAFRGRGSERATLDAMLDRVREGESAVLVMRGEAGIGKTALMHYCARQAAGCRVAQVAGVEF